MKKSDFLKSFLFIFLSCVFTTSIFFGVKTFKNRQVSNKYFLEKILLKGKNGDFLSGDLIAEWLDLSIDAPAFSEFDEKQAENRLKKTGAFSSIELKKKAPDCLIVLYELHVPVAIVQDQTNTLLNVEGQIMPYRPLFSLKKLPKVILGENLTWGERIPQKKWELIQKTLMLDDAIILVDLRSCFEKKKQRKELVLEVMREGVCDFVRLDPVDIDVEWERYGLFKETLPQMAQIIDLRFQNMALIEKK